MADLLKSGATMLSDICPVCGTPLFRVKGEVFCAKCNKPVVYQKAMSPQATLSPGYLLDSVEMTIIGKISEANEVLKIEKDPEKLSLYSNLVFGSKSFPSARFVSSTLRLFRFARIIGMPACSANPRSSFFLSFPSHDLSVLHSIKNDFPSLMQTRSIGFDCAALMTRYPSLRKRSLIRYSSLLPVS